MTIQKIIPSPTLDHKPTKVSVFPLSPSARDLLFQASTDKKEKLRKRFLRFRVLKWKCSTSMGNNYSRLSMKPCVYCIIVHNSRLEDLDILYVGSSKNLDKRFNSHSPFDQIATEFKTRPSIYFREFNLGRLEFEKKLITNLKPKYNKQYKNHE